jgi:plastocyanin
MRGCYVLTAVLLSATAAAGCGGSGEDGSTLEAQSGAVAVDAIDNTFRPETIRIEAGTEVAWTNKGRSDHDVVPAEGDDWGVEPDRFAPGARYAHTFTETGTYEYYCSLHGTKTAGMIGSIEVVG